MQRNTFSLNVLEDMDEEILARMEKMSFDVSQARKCIQANQHNTITTTYYLLLKQKLMDGGTIVTAQMLGKQVSQNPPPVMQPAQQHTQYLHTVGASRIPPSRVSYSPDYGKLMVDIMKSGKVSPRSQTSTSQNNSSLYQPLTYQQSPSAIHSPPPRHSFIEAPAHPRPVGLLKYKADKAIHDEIKVFPLRATATKITTMSLESDIAEMPNIGPVRHNSAIKQLLLGYSRYAKDKPDIPENESSANQQLKPHKVAENELINLSVLGSKNKIQITSAQSSIREIKKTNTPKSSKPKASNIYLNIKKLTASSKATSTSGRSKNESKSSSISREKIKMMKSIDLVLDRSSGTTRKTSNPSLQSSLVEDSHAKSFIVTTHPEQEARKSRNAFSLDYITEFNPKDIMREILLQLKKSKLNFTIKVGIRTDQDTI